jgi:hypothetical protein
MSTTEITRGRGRALVDGWVVAKRNLIKIKRVPDILVFVLISPIMFVLLFAYVFGGAIDVPGDVDYKEFLIAGIFAQTVVFGATFTGYGLADDMQKGIIDRFRSLPMSPSAVLVGRTTSDVAYNVISLVIMALTGLLVGWRIREGFVDGLLGFLVLLVFAYAISWIMAGVVLRRAAHLRGVEPGLDGHPGLPRTLRQHRPRRAGARLVGDAEPRALHPHLVRRDRGGLRAALGAPVPPLHPQVTFA